MREYAEQLRARAREAQELSDRLRREADEMDQTAQRMMGRGPGPQPMSPDGRQEMIKRQIERLRDEARRAKEQSRMEESKRMWEESDRLEQELRAQGPGERGQFGKPVPPEVQDILRAAEQAEREGRMDDARRQREKAEMVARQFEEQRMRQGGGQPGPREDERQQIKRKIEELRNEAQKAKEQNRMDDADRLWKDADRLEQKLREQGPPADERQQIKAKIMSLRDEAQKAKEQNRSEDADRLWKDADRLEQQLRGQGPREKGESGKQAAPKLKDELLRSMGEIKNEIGRLWQAVNEMRSRPKGERPT
jgi:hypothetical protein